MADQNINNQSVTWNSGGTTFAAVKMNVTDTASAVGSMLLQFQVGGSDKFSVRKDGKITTAGDLSVAGNATITGNVTISGTLSAAGLTGTVTGPASSTDNAIARFNGTTGGVIQNSGVTIDDSNNLVAPGNITSGQNFQSSTTNVVVQPSAAGTVWLEPNPNSATGALTVGSSGLLTVRGAATINGNTTINGTLTVTG